MIIQLLLIPVHLILTFLLFIFWLIFYITGFFFVPIGLLTVNEKTEHMFFFFWPWDSYAGVNGTLDGNNANWIDICGSAEETKTYKNRFIWLAWRNPCSNIGTEVLGVKLANRPLNTYINTKIFNLQSSGWLWHIGFYFPIGTYRFGWKLQDRGQFICRISPFSVNYTDPDWQSKSWF